MSFQGAFNVLNRAFKEKVLPSAVAVIGQNGKIIDTHSVGNFISDDGKTYPTKLNTIYDCASLTKVVVTLPLVLKLVEKGLLSLDESVASLIPGFSTQDKSSVTIKHLLTHTSGLPSSINLYSQGWSVEQIKENIYNQELKYTPGSKVVYSDLGFILLGEIISRILHLSLDKAADQFIFQPLGMKDTLFCPPAELKERISPTEYREALGSYQLGQVHDENASALGGVCGHAGLFSTAIDLANYASMWLKQGKWDSQQLISSVSVTAARINYTGHLSSARGLGWVLKGDSFDVSGDLLSDSCFGHTGFTGTSIWLDPKLDLFIILLTNRVHFGRDISINYLRRRFHNAVAASIKEGKER
jgi:CubicO group peptidase (beta-lactamase class C family)